MGSILGGAQGMCSDTNGNVYLLYRNAAIEYAHGGTSPIRTLRTPGSETVGCAVDPVTNDVAVTFSCPPCDYQDLAIFPSGSGTPTRYSAPLAYKCTYDNQGNLFLAGGVDSEISELPYGSQNFTIISINKEIDEPGQVQWDGKYVTLQTLRSPMRIYRIQISGSTGTVVSETKINRYMHRTGYSWISPSDGTVVVPFSAHSDVPNTLGIWRYPRGRSIKSIKNIGSGEVRFGSVTVSVAPSR